MSFRRRFHGLYLAALGATACQSNELTRVVVEGELSPKFELHGEISFSAFRESFLCRRNLLQQPTRLDEQAPATFERKGNWYRLVYDSKHLTRGGFCQWRPDVLTVEARLPGKDSGSTVLRLVSSAGRNHTMDSWRVVEAKQSAYCRTDREVSQRVPVCDYLKRKLDDTAEEVHLSLDVLEGAQAGSVHD